jgi:hypothetical protein
LQAFALGREDVIKVNSKEVLRLGEKLVKLKLLDGPSLMILSSNALRTFNLSTQSFDLALVPPLKHTQILDFTYLAMSDITLVLCSFEGFEDRTVDFLANDIQYNRLSELHLLVKQGSTSPIIDLRL